MASRYSDSTKRGLSKTLLADVLIVWPAIARMYARRPVNSWFYVCQCEWDGSYQSHTTECRFAQTTRCWCHLQPIFMSIEVISDGEVADLFCLRKELGYWKFKIRKWALSHVKHSYNARKQMFYKRFYGLMQSSHISLNRCYRWGQALIEQSYLSPEESANCLASSNLPICDRIWTFSYAAIYLLCK